MTNIYVGNLLYATTEDDLVEFFSQWGEVECATLIYDRETSRPRGFAFVEMPDAAQAAEAVANAHGAELNGRPLTVNEARPRGSGAGPARHSDHATHAGSQHQEAKSHGNSHALTTTNPAPPAEYLPQDADPEPHYTTAQSSEPVRRSGGYTNHLQQ